MKFKEFLRNIIGQCIVDDREYFAIVKNLVIERS